MKYLLEQKNFILVVASKNLLNNAKIQAETTNESFVATDSTHKLISCQFKFSTFMTINYSHKAADFAYMIHSHEDRDSFAFGLQAIKETLKNNLNFEWSPRVISYHFFPLKHQ